MSDVTLSLDTARAVFDVAVNSLDFGSGFLDDEEVTACRAFAVAIGVDPIEATPVEFHWKYGLGGGGMCPAPGCFKDSLRILSHIAQKHPELTTEWPEEVKTKYGVES